MLVEAKKMGFFGGERIEGGDKFTIETRLPKEAKKEEHAVDIQKQFSSKWMTKL